MDGSMKVVALTRNERVNVLLIFGDFFRSRELVHLSVVTFIGRIGWKPDCIIYLSGAAPNGRLYELLIGYETAPTVSFPPAPHECFNGGVGRNGADSFM